jgi:hypothetical protein
MPRAGAREDFTPCDSRIVAEKHGNEILPASKGDAERTVFSAFGLE